MSPNDKWTLNSISIALDAVLHHAKKFEDGSLECEFKEDAESMLRRADRYLERTSTK